MVFFLIYIIMQQSLICSLLSEKVIFCRLKNVLTYELLFLPVPNYTTFLCMYTGFFKRYGQFFRIVILSFKLFLFWTYSLLRNGKLYELWNFLAIAGLLDTESPINAFFHNKSLPSITDGVGVRGIL